MRYLYKRGRGGLRRVMHLCGYDPTTGQPTMQALCGSKLAFDTTCNLPLGQRRCKRCFAILNRPPQDTEGE
jgi:hypothetical protein